MRKINIENNIKKMFIDWIAYWFAVCAGIAVLLFLITCVWIGHDVRSQCERAEAKYNKDCTESLIDHLNNETVSFREKNSAVWVLGQLGDKRALSTLESYYTGFIPKRESLDGGISQYELKKAISLIVNGFNITSVFWK